MRIGLKLWSTNTGNYLACARELFARGVYDYIELYAVPGSLCALEQWAALDIPYIIHAPHSASGVNLADKQKRASNLERYGEVKAFADALKARHIIFHGGVDGSTEELICQLSGLGEPRALLENKPVRPLPQLTNAKACRGCTVDEIRKVMQQTGCGFCLDFGHAAAAANSLGIDPYAHMEAFLKLRPAMFHLSDLEDIRSEFDSHMHLGAGHLDIPRIAALLPQDAIISIETEKDSAENLNDFEKDAQWLKHSISPS